MRWMDGSCCWIVLLWGTLQAKIEAWVVVFIAFYGCEKRGLVLDLGAALLWVFA